MNEKPGGEVVYDLLDDPDIIAKDIAKFTTMRLVGIFGAIEKRMIDERGKKTYALMQKDLGKLWTAVLDPVTLAYSRKPKILRDLYQMKKLEHLFKWFMKTKNPPKTDAEAQMRIRNFFRKIRGITEDWEKPEEEANMFYEMLEKQEREGPPRPSFQVPRQPQRITP